MVIREGEGQQNTQNTEDGFAVLDDGGKIRFTRRHGVGWISNTSMDAFVPYYHSVITHCPHHYIFEFSYVSTGT
jgi:hypothetical protein